MNHNHIQNETKIMAIDYGEKRMGIAISDSEKKFAFPRETYFRISLKKDLHYIIDFCINNQIDTIVLGDPINMDDSLSHMHEKVVSFKKQLEKKIRYSTRIHQKIQVILFDERETSSFAHEILHAQNIRGKKKKGRLDAIAASAILEMYLKENKYE